MNGIQKSIKILAICFAVFLIVNIFGFIIFGLSFMINIGEGRNTENLERIEREYSYTQEDFKNIENIDIDIGTSRVSYKKRRYF